MQLQKMSPPPGPQHRLPCTVSSSQTWNHRARPGQEQPGTRSLQGRAAAPAPDGSCSPGKGRAGGKGPLAPQTTPRHPGRQGGGQRGRGWLGARSHVRGADAFIIQVEGEGLLLELLGLGAVPQARPWRGPGLALRGHRWRVPERGWQLPQRRPLPLGPRHRRPGLPGGRGGRLAQNSPLLRWRPRLRRDRGGPGPGHGAASHKGHLLQGQGTVSGADNPLSTHLVHGHRLHSTLDLTMKVRGLPWGAFSGPALPQRWPGSSCACPRGCLPANTAATVSLSCPGIARAQLCLLLLPQTAPITNHPKGEVNPPGSASHSGVTAPSARVHC